MSFASAFTELSFPLLPLVAVLRAAFLLALLSCLLMFFRPLLSGIVRALLLMVRPLIGRIGRTVRTARAAAGSNA